ncbi:MAG: hypothetical protein ACOYN4_03005 [Bacteroidales bacterium]
MDNIAIQIGTMARVQGCVTQENQVLGRTPQEMEKLLGFPTGYLAKGAIIYALTKLPKNSQFALASSYTNIATSKEEAIRENASRFTPEEIEIEKRIMKRDPLENQKNMSKNSWSESGSNRLVKVCALHPVHFSQYPPGDGVKQWILLEDMDAKTVAVLGYNENYIAGK